MIALGYESYGAPESALLCTYIRSLTTIHDIESGSGRRLGLFRKFVFVMLHFALNIENGVQIGRKMAHIYGHKHVKAWHTNMPV